MALFKKRPREEIEAYPTLSPDIDAPGLGPAADFSRPRPGMPATPGLPSYGPSLPQATIQPSLNQPHMEILQNKIDMLISKIDALRSALDMLNQKIAQLEQQQRQQPPVEQRFDIYGSDKAQQQQDDSSSSNSPSSSGSDYSGSGSSWQF